MAILVGWRFDGAILLSILCNRHFLRRLACNWVSVCWR
jgi:hypothetical protein